MTRVLLLFVSFSLLLLSCRKDELALPSRVTFNFELNSYEEKDQSDLKQIGGPPDAPPGGPPFRNISVNRGEIFISSLEFDGKREQGQDVFFASNLRNPLHNDPMLVNLQNGLRGNEIHFDIPQGVYNKIDIFLQLGNEDKIPLVLEGIITQSIEPVTIPVRFEYNLRDQIRVRAEDRRNEGKIVLTRDSPSVATILLDAEEVFMFTRLPTIRNAEIYEIDGVKTIIISNKKNTQLFNLMANRVDRSFRVIFE